MHRWKSVQLTDERGESVIPKFGYDQRIGFGKNAYSMLIPKMIWIVKKAIEISTLW